MDLLKLMRSNQKKKIIFDANVIIDLHNLELWSQVIHGCDAAIGSVIHGETRFYIDKKGNKKPINLAKQIAEKKIEIVCASLKDIAALSALLNDFFLDSIDAGEQEIIALIHSSQRKNEFLFCTADKLAIECLGILGLRYQGISLEELLQKLHIPTKLRLSYSKQAFEKMLCEGFQEAHLHKN